MNCRSTLAETKATMKGIVMSNQDPDPNEKTSICPWCKTDAAEAAAHQEGPHATWCPYFHPGQRGGTDSR
jgi:hypothetical protein